jgi:capsular polysaccharide biosynthesis protein
MAGLALGLLLAGIREYFDHRLQSTQDVERYLGMDTLGIVPELHKAKA